MNIASKNAQGAITRHKTGSADPAYRPVCGLTLGQAPATPGMTPWRRMADRPVEHGQNGNVSDRYAVSANNSRPISIRRISLVPAPISYNFASRNKRPVG